MSNNKFNYELDLLIPSDIPLDSQLDTKTGEKLREVLDFLLQSLEATDVEISLSKVDFALKLIGNLDTTDVEITSTETSLKDWEVEDYDRYFQINRIQTPDPEIALVRGVLMVTKNFFLLYQECGDRIDIVQSQTQIQGLIQYTYLLARIFKLEI